LLHLKIDKSNDVHVYETGDNIVGLNKNHLTLLWIDLGTGMVYTCLLSLKND